MSATPGVAKSSAVSFTVRTIKLVISISYFALWFVWCQLPKLLGKKKIGTGVVLYYHSVPRSYRRRFKEQMSIVAGETRPIALNEINNLPDDTHSVAITFDDGLESFLQNAVPVLQELNIPATVFAVADALGTKPGWGVSYYDDGERVMSDEQLRGLPDLISVGSHTLTHPNLVALNRDIATQEITNSRKKLESLSQRPITTFSFPHGDFNDFVLSQCREAGYERVCTTNPTLNQGNQTGFVVGRVAADPWDWRLEFKLKMLGAYCWQSRIQSEKQWIKQVFSRTRRNPRGSENTKVQSPNETLVGQPPVCP